jgi:hypothetical protein
MGRPVPGHHRVRHFRTVGGAATGGPLICGRSLLLHRRLVKRRARQYCNWPARKAPVGSGVALVGVAHGLCRALRRRSRAQRRRRRHGWPAAWLAPGQSITAGGRGLLPGAPSCPKQVVAAVPRAPRRPPAMATRRTRHPGGVRSWYCLLVQGCRPVAEPPSRPPGGTRHYLYFPPIVNALKLTGVALQPPSGTYRWTYPACR